MIKQELDDNDYSLKRPREDSSPRSQDSDEPDDAKKPNISNLLAGWKANLRKEEPQTKEESPSPPPDRPRSRQEYFEEMSEEMTIPRDCVGAVMGNHCATLHDLEDQTNCHIRVFKEEEHDGSRIARLRGTRGAIDAAKELISDIIREVEKRPPNRGGGGGRFDRGRRIDDERIILIPQVYVGSVIGKGGEMLRGIERKSNCGIIVSKVERKEKPDRREVTIRGRHTDDLDLAETLINEVIDSVREKEQSGEHTEMLEIAKNHVGIVMGEKATTLRFIQDQSGSHIVVSKVDSDEASPGMRVVKIRGTQKAIDTARSLIADVISKIVKEKGLPPVDEALGIVDSIEIPHDIAGAVIGKECVTLNFIQDKSQCSVHVQRDVGEANKRKVRIKGPTSEAIQTAKDMIRRVVDRKMNEREGGPPNGDNKALSDSMQIPVNKCGKLVGRGGSTLKSIMELSGTFLVLEDKGEAIVAGYKTLSIKADNHEQIDYAKRLVEDTIYDDEQNVEGDEQKFIGEVVVPKRSVARIIGKSGEMLRKITLATGADLKFSKEAQRPDAREEVAVITGTHDQIQKATQFVSEIVQEVMAEGLLGDAPADYMNVPNRIAGIIIGKGGQSLRELESECGCRLSFDPTDKDQPMRRLKIQGDVQQIFVARSIVNQKIFECSRYPHTGPGPQAHLPLQTHKEYMSVPSDAAAKIIGRSGETVIRIQKESQCRVFVEKTQYQDPMHTMRTITLERTHRSIQHARMLIGQVIQGGTGAQFDNTGDSDSEVQTCHMTVPKGKIGMIIGMGGDTIRDIEKKSACRRVFVPRAPGGRSEEQRTVELVGTLQQIGTARQLIQERIGEDAEISMRFLDEDDTIADQSYEDASSESFDYQSTVFPPSNVN